MLTVLWSLPSCLENTRTGICGEGKNVCFEVDGTVVAFNAHWHTTSSGYQITGTDMIGTDTLSFIVYFGSLKPDLGSFFIDPNSLPTEILIDYVKNSQNRYSINGVVNITNVFQNRVTGNFNANIEDEINADTIHIINGHLDAIEQQ